MPFKVYLSGTWGRGTVNKYVEADVSWGHLCHRQVNASGLEKVSNKLTSNGFFFFTGNMTVDLILYNRAHPKGCEVGYGGMIDLFGK